MRSHSTMMHLRKTKSHLFEVLFIKRIWTRIFDIPNETIELISIKVTALAITPKPQMPRRGSHGELPSPCEERMVFSMTRRAPAAVYRREEIPVGKNSWVLR